MGKATQVLRDDHEVILNVLGILDRMILMNSKEDLVLLQYYDEFTYFLKIFADKSHHEKEENFFFRVLINKGLNSEGAPIGIMLEEHNQGRKYVALMNKSLETKDLAEFNIVAKKYLDLSKDHMENENKVLFTMADQLLDNAEQEDLFEKFKKHEESVIGYGIHEKFQSMIHKWAIRFKI
jgi:hemerythrin-like domain-containing protein